MFDIRLRLYSTAGAKQRVLRCDDFTYTLAESGTPTLKFTVSERVAGNLDAPFLVGVEYSTGGAWQTPRDNLFIATREDTDGNDETRTVKFSGEGLVAWWTRMIPVWWVYGAGGGVRTWTDVTPGKLLADIVSDGKGFGWAPNLALGFTTGVDSAGNAWTEKVTQTFRYFTTPFSQVLSALSSQGYLEWWSEGLTLCAANPGTGRNRTQTVLGGPGFSSAPAQTSFEVFTHLLLPFGDQGVWTHVANPGADTRFGALFASMSQDGVPDIATATRNAQPAMTESRQPKRELAYEWAPTDATPAPFADVRVGDQVTVRTRRGKLTQRVIGFVLSKKDGAVTVRAVVGSKLLTMEARVARRVAAASQGNLIGGSGSVIPISGPAVKDTTPPPAPSKPDISVRLGVVTVTWDGLDTTGSAMPADFERCDVVRGPAPGKVVGTVGIGKGLQSWPVTGLPYNSTQEVWLRAVDVSGNVSADSEHVSVVIKPLVDTDLIGRVIDSANVKLGAVKAELIEAGAVLTDKLAANAVTLAKLDTVVQQSISDANSNATTANGRVTTSLSAPVAGDGTGKPTGALWFRYNAGGTLLGTWRWSGSAWAAQAWGEDALASGAVTQAKIAANAVTVTKIANGAVEAGKIAANAVTAEKIADLAVNAGKIADNAVTVTKIANGAIETGKLAAKAVDASRLADSVNATIQQAATDAANAQATATTANGRVTISDSAPVVGDGSGRPTGALWYRRDGSGQVIGMWEWSGSAWATRPLASAAIADAAITDAKIATGAVLEAKIADAAVATAKLKDSAVTETKIANLAVGTAKIADAAIVEAKIGNLAVSTAKIANGAIVDAKIQNGTIQTASIADAAITDAKIANLNAGKIGAGYIDAARIAAKSLTAEKLVIAATGNLIPNGSFTDGLAGWDAYAPFAADTVPDGPDGGVTAIMRATPTTADQSLMSTAYPAYPETSRTAYEPGTSFAFRLRARVVSGTAGSIRTRLGFHGIGQNNQWPAVSGTQLNASSATPGQWVTLEGVYTTPVGNPRDRMSVSIHTSGAVGTVFEVAEVTMRQMASAKLIVDGAITADKIAANAVTANEIASNAITTVKLNANAVTTAKIAASAVTAAEIAAGAVVAGKIAANSVTATEILAGTITANEIASNAITTVKLNANAVTTAKIAASAVTAAEIAAGAVVAGKIAANSVTATEIVAGTITAASGIIADAAIGTAQIADAAITNAKIASLDAGKISAGTLDAARIAAKSLTAEKIAALTITANEIAANAVIARTIAAGAITTDKIFANAVTTAKIATNAVTANEIAALTITANEIAANAITAAKIAALSIESGKIASNAITADKIDAGAITAVKIAANAIDATRLSATAITSKHTITGAKFQTTSTANRGIEITSAGLNAYDSSGVKTVEIVASSGDVTMAGTFRNRPSGPRVEINSSDTRGIVRFYSNASGATPASITSDPSGEGMLLWSGKAAGDNGAPATLQLYERGNGDILWLGRTDTAGVHFREDGYWRIGHGGVGNFQLRASPSSNEILLRKDPGHYVWLRNDGLTQLSGVGLVVDGSLSVTGSKNFAMEHPAKPGKQLTHASTESPHNGVEYWSDGFIEIPEEGVATVTLPEYFEALTADDHRAITVTAGSPDAGLWVEPITDGAFVVHGAPGALFTWVVKARRVQVVDGVDVLAFPVESVMTLRGPEPDPT